jgi:FkbH-like protein
MNTCSQNSSEKFVEKEKVVEKKILKCIVWDLDNTMWHGILSENDDLKLRNGIKEILEALDKRGILLSIASKNTHEDAVKKLKEFGILDYFLYPQINWSPKSDSLLTIKEKLNIGMDAIAFIDDQTFEREEVVFAHKDVNCYDVDIIEKILEMDEFKPRFITDESAKRRMMYLDDEKRKQEEESWGKTDIKFLESQQMVFDITYATVKDLQRVEELTVRTNQLNVSGYTYTYEELEGFLKSPDHKLFIAELNDKYGSYGKIGVALVECIEDKWTLKLLLMSCRVMSRGVGNVLLNHIMNMAKKEGKKLYTEFLHTDRNRLMYMTLKFAGFKESGETLENGRNLLCNQLDGEYPYPEYLKLSLPA